LADLEGRRLQFEALDTAVLAINPAAIEDHRQYADQLGLHFPILSDPGGRVCRAFQCRVPLLGLIRRTVYAIDPDGRIAFAERGQADLKKVLKLIKERVPD